MAEPRVAIAYDCLFPVNTGGGERVYRRLAELLVERCSTVDYVTREQWPAGQAPPTTFNVVAAWSGEIYDAGGTRTLGSALGFARGVFSHFRHHRQSYDLVIVSALPVLNIFAVKLALLGTPAMIVSDWLEIWTWRKWREYSGALVGTIAWMLQFLGIWLGREQTVNSDFTRRNLRRYRGRASPIVLGLLDLVDEPVVVVDAESVTASGATGATGSPTPLTAFAAPYAFFAGRHIADKRLDALPAGLAVARSRVPGLRLVVAGAGPETPALVDAAHRAGVSDVVDIIGRVSEHELGKLFAHAAVMVNPSAREGFGLVVAEAASVGTPSVVVSGPDNAAAELIEAHVNGLVAESADPVALGDALAEVVLAGGRLRVTTLAWFQSARAERNLGRSIDELIARYRSARARRND
ncbi:glycosyltransferase family 4 protein [Leifsonia sp. YAF41]|uniref:glycosyltransferase family 4 protein n=1 Tax=Leifsonia sp. YAF41 TaxID=3233086 RepID=UPI003F969B63